MRESKCTVNSCSFLSVACCPIFTKAGSYGSSEYLSIFHFKSFLALALLPDCYNRMRNVRPILTQPQNWRIDRHLPPVRRLRLPHPHHSPLRASLYCLHLRHRRVLPPHRAPVCRKGRLRHLVGLPSRRRRIRGLQSVSAQPAHPASGEERRGRGHHEQRQACAGHGLVEEARGRAGGGRGGVVASRG
jgi:hypothetical protein